MLVSSSTTRGARGSRLGPLVTALKASLVVSILLGLTVGSSPIANAENLDDARAKVRKALVQTKKELASDKAAVNEASDRLESSQATLGKAKSELARVRKQLAKAKTTDAAVAAKLKTAEEAQIAATAAVAEAEADVAAQKSLIGVVVRSAYQQHGTLVGFTMIVGTESATDLAQRVQWSSTMFDNSTAQLDRLTTLEAQLGAAKARRVAAEAELAAERKATAEHVAEVKRLTSAAAEREDEVADLVAANAKAKAAAEDELEETRDQYEALEKQEAKIAAKLRKPSHSPVNKDGFITPVNAGAGSPFGLRYHPILHYWRMHWGTDFGAGCGTPIRAMADGRVVSAGWTSYGFGNYTIISYGRMYGANLASGYAHQSRVVVHSGQKVKQGQIVGYVGTTGLSTGCHLHLQVYRNGARVNPMRYL